MNHLQRANSYRLIGVGNAGVNFLDRLLVTTPAFAGLIALNNDQEALAASVVATKIPLATTSEPVAALAEVKEHLIAELGDALVVLLTGGLGGSVASSLLPELARKAKEAKKVTLACVTLPFSFEGKRAQTVAAEALAALEQICDGIIVLDNNALCAANTGTAKLGETFTASDEALQAALPALLAMFLNKGPVRITRADLLAALSRQGAMTRFGYGQATGPNRLHEAVERAFKNPLLDRGRFLGKANAIFILLRGPKNLSFAEAQMAMQEIERFAKEDHDIQLSVQAEGPEGAPLELFLLAVAGGSSKRVALEKAAIKLSDPLAEKKEAPEKILPSKRADEAPVHQELFPKTVYSNPAETKASPAKPKQTQGALNLTAAQRGRFDKSEPTIVEGEDLDTPTYLRLGLNLTTKNNAS